MVFKPGCWFVNKEDMKSSILSKLFINFLKNTMVLTPNKTFLSKFISVIENTNQTILRTAKVHVKPCYIAHTILQIYDIFAECCLAFFCNLFS